MKEQGLPRMDLAGMDGMLLGSQRLTNQLGPSGKDNAGLIIHRRVPTLYLGRGT
jgi:hypothetical protein